MDIKRVNELVSLLKDNKYEYFDEFYEITKEYIFYNIVKIVNSFSDAEDILQDTYIYFLKKVNTIKNGSSPIGYLLLTAKHKAIDFIRKNKRVVNDEEYINYHYYTEYKPTNNHLINDLKEKLNKEDLELLILHVLDGLTHKEIAKLYDKPIGTILWRYNKIINFLRKELDYENYR